MAKYDWKQLEKEYILSDYTSVRKFLSDKNIPNNGNTKKSTKGWKNKKVLNEERKSTKVIEKVLEKESEKEAEKIVTVKNIANDLLLKVVQAQNELNMHLVRNKKKTKTVNYDYKCNKPFKEIINEEEEIKSYIDIIDRKGLKELTSALKDLSDILTNKQTYDTSTKSLADTIQEAYENKIGEKNVND